MGLARRLLRAVAATIFFIGNLERVLCQNNELITSVNFQTHPEEFSHCQLVTIFFRMLTRSHVKMKERRVSDEAIRCGGAQLFTLLLAPQVEAFKRTATTAKLLLELPALFTHEIIVKAVFCEAGEKCGSQG